MRFLVGIGALNFENASKNRKNLRKILIAFPAAKHCLSTHVENSTIIGSSAPTTAGSCVEVDGLKTEPLPKPILSELDLDREKLLIDDIPDSPYYELAPEEVDIEEKFNFLQNFIINAKDYAGISWIPTIFLFAFSLRMCLSPFHVWGNSLTNKVKILHPIMQKLENECNEAYSQGLNQRSITAAGKLAEFQKAEKYNPKMVSLPYFFMVPIQLFGFTSMRKILLTSSPLLDSMKNDGFLWFKDLTVADPYYILPLVCVTIQTLNISLTRRAPKYDTKNLSWQDYILSKVVPFSPFICLPFYTYFQAGLMMHLISSSLFTTILTVLANRFISTHEALKLKYKDELVPNILDEPILTQASNIWRGKQDKSFEKRLHDNMKVRVKSMKI